MIQTSGLSPQSGVCGQSMIKQRSTPLNITVCMWDSETTNPDISILAAYQQFSQMLVPGMIDVKMAKK